MDNINNRKLDLSVKFLEMGYALRNEGETTNDYSIIQSGNLMVLLSTLILNDIDLYEFSYISSMFASKKILDESNIDSNNLKNADESYLDFIKKIKKLRDGK